MHKRALLFASTLIAAGMSASPEAASPSSRQSQPPWLRRESRRFEIHYQRALAPDVGRVVRSAEAAYDQISRRLNFVLATKVPLVVWSDDDTRLMRGLVASGGVPALSRLTGGGGFADERLNEALGHAAFDYIESRWGPTSIRRFLDALIVPRVDKTYDSVFELTPAEFDAAFRQYAERQFRSSRLRSSVSSR